MNENAFDHPSLTELSIGIERNRGAGIHPKKQSFPSSKSRSSSSKSNPVAFPQNRWSMETAVNGYALGGYAECAMDSESAARDMQLVLHCRRWQFLCSCPRPLTKKKRTLSPRTINHCIASPPLVRPGRHFACFL